jgi:O-acetyl-ADP-ribose deacetylase (regulator of RNase III)
MLFPHYFQFSFFPRLRDVKACNNLQKQGTHSGQKFLTSCYKKPETRHRTVAHTCNPSYSGGRDQKDFDSKSAWANSSGSPYLDKIPHKKRGLVEWLKV